jgi:hypothetical protein
MSAEEVEEAWHDPDTSLCRMREPRGHGLRDINA